MKAMLIVLLLLPFASFAGKTIDKQIKIPNEGKVFIHTHRGVINIMGWDKNQIKVSGELDDQAQGYALNSKGKNAQFIVKVPDDTNSHSGDKGANLTIFIPKRSELKFVGVDVLVNLWELENATDIKINNGAINANSLSGDVILNSVNGDISAQELSGDIFIKTVNGSISDNRSSGKLLLSTNNGYIESNTDAIDVHLESVNGDADFTFSAIKKLRIVTAHGTVTARIKSLLTGRNTNFRPISSDASHGDVKARINSLFTGRNVDFGSVSGDADFYFDKDVSANFSIKADAFGEIVNNFSADKVHQKEHNAGSSLNFSLNGGEAKVLMESGSGRITLNKLQKEGVK